MALTPYNLLKACTGVSEANKEICVAHSIKHRDNYREYAHATLCKFLLSLPRHMLDEPEKKKHKKASRPMPTCYSNAFVFSLWRVHMKPKISNRKYYRQLDELKKERTGYIHIIIISLSIILIQGSFIYMYLADLDSLIARIILSSIIPFMGLLLFSIYYLVKSTQQYKKYINKNKRVYYKNKI